MGGPVGPLLPVAGRSLAVRERTAGDATMHSRERVDGGCAYALEDPASVGGERRFWLRLVVVR